MCSCLTTTMQVVKTGYRRYLVDIMWICIYVGPAASKWSDQCREFGDDFWTNLSFLCSDVFCSTTWCRLAYEIWKNLQRQPTLAAHESWENLTVGSPMNYVSHHWSLCGWAHHQYSRNICHSFTLYPRLWRTLKYSTRSGSEDYNPPEPAWKHWGLWIWACSRQSIHSSLWVSKVTGKVDRKSQVSLLYYTLHCYLTIVKAHGY